MPCKLFDLVTQRQESAAVKKCEGYRFCQEYYSLMFRILLVEDIISNVIGDALRNGSLPSTASIAEILIYIFHIIHRKKTNHFKLLN